MGRLGKITRRTLLVGAVAIAGGVAFGYYKYKQPYDNPLDDDPEGAHAITPYIKIDGDGITIIAPRAEMGQGVYTTLAALVAEELDVNLDDINIEHGPASSAYYNAAVLEDGAPFPPYDQSSQAKMVRDFMHVPAKFLGLQITGGSSSIPDAYEKMRIAGAAARQAFLQAAAKVWNAKIEDLATEDGTVIGPDGQTATYIELAEDAAKIDLPSEVTLKDKSEWRYLGKAVPKKDMTAKVTGTAQFGIDVRLPDMAFASVKMNPNLTAPMKSFSANGADSMPGVEKIIELKNGVAVIANNSWRAFQALEAIEFEWETADYPQSQEEHFTKVEKSIHADHLDSQKRNDGDMESAMAEGNIISADYKVPYLAHATMEPMNATAWLHDGILDVWAGTQFPTHAKTEAAQITGLEENQVNIHTTFLGGGFGRRAEMDFIIYAVHLAKEMEGRPVQVTWTREEDMTHDAYRPLAIAQMKGIMKEGLPHAFDGSIGSPSVFESQLGRLGMSMPGPDDTIVQGGWEQPYDIPNYRYSGYRTPKTIPIAAWRSVGASFNGFFHECFLDEMAHAGGVDPLEMRLKLMEKWPAHRKVLETVAEMSNWGSNPGLKKGRGVAFNLSFGVPVAQVIEVLNSTDGIKIKKIYAVADVGTALDPDNLNAQIQSGIIYGLSAAIMGEITIEDGIVSQTNFDSYDALRINQIPDIEVKILENTDVIRGIGEPGTPPSMPALANAIFNVTGQRIRELPLNKHIDFA